MVTKIEVAMSALEKLRVERGDHFLRTQASGSLQCAMGKHLDKDSPYHMGEISEATINQARRRILEGK